MYHGLLSTRGEQHALETPLIFQDLRKPRDLKNSEQSLK